MRVGGGGIGKGLNPLAPFNGGDRPSSDCLSYAPEIIVHCGTLPHSQKPGGKQTLRSLELFTGAGGLALGTHAVGFKHVALLDWNRDACATPRENIRHDTVAGVSEWKVIEGDVRECDYGSLGSVQLVSGGPPCQPFSIGGKHQGMDDGRDMIPEFIRAIREAQPAAFLFENVKGLTRKSFRNYLAYIELRLQHPEFPGARSILGRITWADLRTCTLAEVARGFITRSSVAFSTRPTTGFRRRANASSSSGFDMTLTRSGTSRSRRTPAKGSSTINGLRASTGKSTILRALEDNGTRCSRPDLVRSSGIVQIPDVRPSPVQEAGTRYRRAFRRFLHRLAS